MRTTSTPAFAVYAFGLVSAVLMALFLLYTVVRALDLPEVHVSYSTKECVRVDDPAAEHEDREPYTCGRLPERYRRVWVY